ILKQLLFLSILINLSCIDNDVQNLEKNSFIQSVILPDTITMGSPFNIEFEISVSGCWTYSRLEKEIDEKNTSFKIFIINQSRDDATVNCPTGFFTETIKEQIVLSSLGSNDLIFNDSTLIKRIFVTN
ncbi:hypothetical protein N9J39_02920, partial [Flavicella sp.]